MVARGIFVRLLDWTKLWLLDSGASIDMRTKPIAKLAKLATSQSNPWLTAIRLHESGNYDDAWPNYFLDAKRSKAAGLHGRAALSLALAADCLESIDKRPLAMEMLELARECYLRQAAVSSSPDETRWARVKAEKLLATIQELKVET